MENKRYQWFLVAIGAGLIFGLILGWSVFERKAAELPLPKLRDDYKVDYVLMVATIFSNDSDLASARVRLALVDDAEDPVALVQMALDNPFGMLMVDKDVQALSKLLLALQGGSASVESGRVL